MPSKTYEKHGLSRSREYSTWQCMKKRCYNPNACDYKHYGGRGIKVCKRWRESFIAFFEDMGLRPGGLTLDRINNDGNYCKENCRWATRAEQGRNNRHVVEFNGKSMCVAEWAEEIGIHRDTLWGRLKSGWSIEQTLTQTVRPWGRNEV